MSKFATALLVILHVIIVVSVIALIQWCGAAADPPAYRIPHLHLQALALSKGQTYEYHEYQGLAVSFSGSYWIVTEIK